MHWKKMFNPDYIGAYELEEGQELILTIKTVQPEMVTGDRGRKEELLVARFEENVKPMILNKTNCKTIQKIYRTPEIEKWMGKKIQIYATTTTFGGEVVECLRIRDKAPVIEPPVYCESCKKAITPALGMTANQLSQYTFKKYGAKLCADCATRKKN
ncbi:MAG: hypothetical protein IKY39_01870 [Clostridia bacterium]|nr:hypothetical protein [Clostridia bacterium]